LTLRGEKVGNFGNFSGLGGAEIPKYLRIIMKFGTAERNVSPLRRNFKVTLIRESCRDDKPQNRLLSNFNTGGCPTGNKQSIHGL